MEIILIFLGGFIVATIIAKICFSVKSVYLQTKIDNLENKLKELRKNKRK